MYRDIAYFVGIVVFIVSWVICSYSAGFTGFLLGWIPSLLVGYLAGAAWPVTILGCLLFWSLLFG